VLKSELKRGSFAQGSLRQGEKLFLQALTGEMVGSVGRGHGRGRGDRLEEEQWGNGPGWWNQSFHPRPFPHLQFQQPFGFYVNHMLGLMPRMLVRCQGQCPVRYTLNSILKCRCQVTNHTTRGHIRTTTRVQGRERFNRGRSKLTRF
jgi:hypothetical protein